MGGVALPTRSAPDHVFVWPAVVLGPGPNVVEASAVVGGHRLRDRVTLVGAVAR